MAELVTNCDRFNSLKHSTVRSYAFTEQGVAMLSTVLRSETAIRVSIRIMDAFVAMRRFMVTNAEVFQRLSTIAYSTLNEILNARRPVTEKTALLFEAALGVNAEPLLKMQMRYNLQSAKNDSTFMARLAKVRRVAAGLLF